MKDSVTLSGFSQCCFVREKSRGGIINDTRINLFNFQPAIALAITSIKKAHLQQLHRSVAPVPTTEDPSVSSSVPKTTPMFTTTTLPTLRGQGDTTGAGADPREGRILYEDSHGSVTSEPTVPELPPTPRRFCEATRRRAIDWPQTHTGTTVERPCPKGTRGKCLHLFEIHIFFI